MEARQWGICTNFLSDAPYALHMEQFPMLSDKFNYIELPAMTVAELDDEAFDQLVRRGKEASAKFSVMTNFFPADLYLLSSHLDTVRLEGYLNRILPRCQRLGCQALVLGSGKARSLQKGQSREKGYQLLSYLLDELILPSCEEHGISVLIEPLNPALSNFILNLWEGAELIDRCKKSLGMVADSLHLMEHPNLKEELMQNRKLISHVHLSEKGRRAPSHPLSPQMSEFLRCLKEVDYNGPVSFECKMEDAAIAIQAKQAVEQFWES